MSLRHYTVISNKCNYIERVGDIIEDGIIQRKNVETADNTYNELRHFQDLLYRHFYIHEHYKEMRPRANQPVRFFATAKTYEFESTSDITLEQLKLRLIIDRELPTL